MKLWRHLERITTIDTHFRKQVPIGPYIADFACLRARLIIEVDGEQHGHDHQRQHDRAWTRWFEPQGFRVLRFWNGEALNDVESVLDAIHSALYGHALAEPHSYSRRASGSGSVLRPEADAAKAAGDA